MVSGTLHFRPLFSPPSALNTRLNTRIYLSTPANFTCRNQTLWDEKLPRCCAAPGSSEPEGLQSLTPQRVPYEYFELSMSIASENSGNKRPLT